MDESLIFQLTLVVILTLVNAFFAASEMAIVSVNKNKISKLAKQGNKKAILVENLLKQPTGFLSTIQIAITLSGFFNSASAATGISNVFAAFLLQLGIPSAQSVSIALITICISFVTLIFGELVPKRLAITKAESFAMFSAPIISLISKIVSPIVKFLSFITTLILKIFHVKDENVDEALSREDIRLILKNSQLQGVLDEDEKEMLDGVLDFDESVCREIMTPRTQVFAININDDAKNYVEVMMQLYYSRIPVYEGDSDHIIGILYLKDFFYEAYRVGFLNVDIRKILRKPFFVPESKKVDDLFKEMQKLQQHIALIVDEYGGFAGIITIEDLIEEVMGDIDDEYDDPLSTLKRLKEHLYEASGSLSIELLNETFGLNISDEQFDTLAGFVMYQLDRVLEDGEKTKIQYEHLIIHVEEVKNHRIEKVLIQEVIYDSM